MFTIRLWQRRNETQRGSRAKRAIQVIQEVLSLDPIIQYLHHHRPMPFAFQHLARAAVGGRLVVVELVVTAPWALADGGVGLGEDGEGPAAAGAGEAVEGVGGGGGWHGKGLVGGGFGFGHISACGGSAGYVSCGFVGIWAGLLRVCSVGGGVVYWQVMGWWLGWGCIAAHRG